MGVPNDLTHIKQQSLYILYLSIYLYLFLYIYIHTRIYIQVCTLKQKQHQYIEHLDETGVNMVQYRDG